MDPPKHTRYRLLVQKGFTPRMIALLEQYLTHRAILIVDNIIERGQCDFVTDLASELPLQAIAEIMGVPQEERKLLFDWSNRMIGLDDPEYAGDKNDGATASAELYMYVNQLAKQRESDPRDDIVTKLINAELDGDKLSEVEFDMFMLLLTVAGNETTRNTTSWGMWALMENPEQYKALVNEPDKLDRAIEEILRWATPVYHFRRTALADTEVHGQEIKQGDRVVMWHTSADRDEEVFDDPFTFDIDRWPNKHIAFGGGGAHYCLGANLARMELQLIFREILERIPDMRLNGPVDMLRSNFIGGVKHMPVTFTPGAKKNPGPVVLKGTLHYDS
jgi:cholest-4-en-3-one 26-monooxygenase